jgi:general secretion pathway protein I
LLRSTAPERSTAGFTLIEVLVALAIVAVSLSSIGALIATTVRGTRSIEHHMTRLATARTIAVSLPHRDQLVPGNFSGEVAGHRWRVDVSPFITTNVGPRQPTPWVPQTVVVTVQPPAGAPVQISTIRLHRRAGG